MVRILRVTDFQGIEVANLKLSPVTVLAGPNGSGKTSLAESIEFALLGESPRGGTVDAVRRAGQDAAEVEITLDDDARTTLTRRVTETTHTRKIGDEKASDKAFAAAIAKHVGDPRAIRAALRSGGLLSMTPKALQDFLVDLTGASFTAAAITKALGDDVAAAALRSGLSLPTSIESTVFSGAEAAAVKRRQAAKQQLAEREADLARAPVPEVDTRDWTPATVEAALKGLRADLSAAERAEAGSSAAAVAAHDERLKGLREAVARAEAEADQAKRAVGQKGRPIADIDRDLGARRREAASSEGRVSQHRATLAAPAVEPRAGDEALAATVAERGQALAEARTGFETAKRERDSLAGEWKALAGKVVTPAEGTCEHACEHCTVANRAKIERETKKAIAAAETKGTAARTRADNADKSVTLAVNALREATDAAERIKSLRARELATLGLTTAEADAKFARDAEAKLEVELDAARACAAAQKLVDDRTAALASRKAELATVEAQVLPEPPTTNVGEIRERIAAEETALRAARAKVERDRCEAAVTKAKLEVKDANTVAVALGKDGVRSQLIAAGVAPFIDAAGEALALFAPGWSVEIDPDEFGIRLRQGEAVFRSEQLSDGHRTRLLYVLQVAVARLARVGIVVFDRAELLDATGTTALRRLVDECVANDVQVLLLAHGDSPLPGSGAVSVYAVEAGTVKRVGAKAVAA